MGLTWCNGVRCTDEMAFDMLPHIVPDNDVELPSNAVSRDWYPASSRTLTPGSRDRINAELQRTISNISSATTPLATVAE